jgi:hypothetical protein
VREEQQGAARPRGRQGAGRVVILDSKTMGTREQENPIERNAGEREHVTEHVAQTRRVWQHAREIFARHAPGRRRGGHEIDAQRIEQRPDHAPAEPERRETQGAHGPVSAAFAVLVPADGRVRLGRPWIGRHADAP